MTVYTYAGNKRAGDFNSAIKLDSGAYLYLGDNADIGADDYAQLSSIYNFIAGVQVIDLSLFPFRQAKNESGFIGSQKIYAKYQQVARRMGNAGAGGNGGTSDTWRDGISSHIIETSFNGSLVGGFINFSTGDTMPTGNMTLKLAMVMPDASIVPITWNNGSSTVTIAPGEKKRHDPVPYAPGFVKGDNVKYRSFATNTSGQSIAWTKTANVADGEGGNSGTGAGVDKTLSGTITAQQFGIIAPVELLAVDANKEIVSVLNLGMSIVSSQGDALALERGYLRHALNQAGIAYKHVAKGGELSTTASTAGTGQLRWQIYGDTDYALIDYATNGLYGATTLAAEQASELFLAQKCADLGARVYLATVIPRPSGTTDNWATLANQTITADTALQTKRLNYNAWVRDGCPIDATTKVAVATGTSSNVLRMGASGHPVYSYWENADTLESSRDSQKWKVTGISGTMTSTSGSPNLTSASITGGVMADMIGMALFGTNVPAGAFVGAASTGTTIAMVNAANAALNATTSASGNAFTTSYTVDGIHPATAGHLLEAAGVPVGSLVAYA